MRILYGVQGTGNGHLSRARAMATEFARQEGLQLDFLFSGRERNKYFDMEMFGDWRSLHGQSFVVKSGKVQSIATIRHSRPLRLLQDIRELAVEKYDLVISDFEPVTAWAARLRKIPCLGLGHQYAFRFPIPQQGGNPATRFIMRNFAPASVNIGMHWYHFNQPIVPPVVDMERICEQEQRPDTIVVYLPFEDPNEVRKLLHQLPDYRFVVYGHATMSSVHRNVTNKPASREGFIRDLACSGGVIANAGFELSSEAITLGKKLLVKPLQGQMEQISNALALKQLGLGACTDNLTTNAIRQWLDHFQGGRVDYPNVARHIAEWIAGGQLDNKDAMIRSLWEQTTAHGVDSFAPYRPAASDTVNGP